MTEYEKLLDGATSEVKVIENYHFDSGRIKGLYCDGVVALSSSLDTSAERKCILAEELGHHQTAVGDIIMLNTVSTRKQELQARIIAYNKLIGLKGIVDCYLSKCQNVAEMSEMLDVSEDFMLEALHYYRGKYGTHTILDNYVIYFEPSLGVFEVM